MCSRCLSLGQCLVNICLPPASLASDQVYRRTTYYCTDASLSDIVSTSASASTRTTFFPSVLTFTYARLSDSASSSDSAFIEFLCLCVVMFVFQCLKIYQCQLVSQCLQQIFTLYFWQCLAKCIKPYLFASILVSLQKHPSLYLDQCGTKCLSPDFCQTLCRIAPIRPSLQVCRQVSRRYLLLLYRALLPHPLRTAASKVLSLNPLTRVST